MITAEIGILGGGLAGIAISYYCNKSSIVLEAAKRSGGLCTSEHILGHTFDIGPHILFSSDPSFRQTAIDRLGDNWREHTRNNKIMYDGKTMGWPFEYNLSQLARAERAECLNGYLNRNANFRGDLRTHLESIYGDPIARKYIIPYTEKVFCKSTYEICDSFFDRVPPPVQQEIVESALGLKRVGYKIQHKFIYPKYGGINAFVDAFRDDDILTNQAVISIRKKRNEFIVDTLDETFKFQHLISTIPLPEAEKLCGLVPHEFEHTTLYVHCFVIDGECPVDWHVCYFPGPEPFHRVTSINYIAPKENTYAIMAETSTPSRYAQEISNEGVSARLIGAGVINGNIKESGFFSVPLAYPVYNLHLARERKSAIDAMEKIGVICFGRWGEWKYYNMDHIIINAKKIADRLNKCE